MQVLGVGQHRVGVGAQEVRVPDVEQAHEQRDVPGRLGGGEVLVHGVEPGQEVLESLRPDGHGQRGADGRVDRVASADPTPEAEGVDRVDAELGHLVQGGGHGDEMLGDGLGARLVGVVDGTGGDQTIKQPGAHAAGIGEGLQGGEGLGGDDDQRGLRVEISGLDGGIRRVDVGDETALQAVLDVGLECFVGHHGAQVGTTDANVDDGADRLAGDAFPLPGTYLAREVVDLVEGLVDVGDGVLAVHGERVGAGTAQGGVQDGTVLGDVDVLPGVHGVAAGRDVGLFGELEQGVTHLVGEQVLGQVDVQVGRVQAEPLGTRRVGFEPPTHDVRTIDEGGLEVGKCGPGRSVGGINRCLHGTQRSWSVEPMWSAVTQPSTQRSGSSHVPEWTTSVATGVGVPCVLELSGNFHGECDDGTRGSRGRSGDDHASTSSTTARNPRQRSRSAFMLESSATSPTRESSPQTANAPDSSHRRTA